MWLIEMTKESFSQRQGFRPTAAPITVREDAPYELRGVLVDICYKHQFTPTPLRNLVCRVLRKRPDPNNWSEFPNIDSEIRMLIDDTEWYRVYDVVEAIYTHMRENGFKYDCSKFEAEINEYFGEVGIGWQLREGVLEIRGEEAFEKAVTDAGAALSDTQHVTASDELHEAITDLSRRPDPDITGAIQHAVAALECVAREVCGDPKANLGAILKSRKVTIPEPLDEGVKKIWGYASEQGRHLREGRTPSFEEARLVVGVAASVATYLANKSEGS